MKKKYLIYVPLALILILQFFDKEDNFLAVQYSLLAIMIIALIVKLAKKTK